MTRVRTAALACGLLGSAVSAIGIVTARQDFMRALLVCFNYVAALALGSLALLMIHHLFRGRWGHAIEQPLQAAIDTLPLVALLLVPILVDLDAVYPWARSEVMATSELLHKKQPYLEVWFFVLRQLAYFAIFLGTAWLVRRRPIAGSAAGLVAFGLVLIFASLDWMMALEPIWYSTIYSLLLATVYLISAAALAILTVILRHGREGRDRLPDLGNLLLAFIMLWVYCAYSQYFLMWAGNLPEEIVWYVRRTETDWRWLILTLIGLHFALPFLILITRRGKRSGLVMLWVVALVLVMRLVDFHWMIDPSLSPNGIHLSWLDLTLPVAVGGLWLALFLWRLDRRTREASDD